MTTASGSTMPVLVGTGLAFASIGALVPVLPQYVTGHLGQGTGVVGLAIAVPSVTGILARPVVGRMADRHGARLMCVLGAAVLTTAAVALLGSRNIAALLCCRALAGIGEALVYVGFATASMPAQQSEGALVKVTRFSIAVYVGLLIGAPVGVVVLSWSGYAGVWMLAAAPAAAGGLCAVVAPARARVEQPVARTPLVHRAGVRPGLAYGASVWGYTAFNTFIPLYVVRIGGHDARAEYLVYGCVLLGVRIFGYRFIEWLEPRNAGIASLALTSTGLVGLMAWPHPAGLLCSTVVLAVGQALGLPAFLTEAALTAPAGQRGAVIATVTAFFDVGFLSCALCLGALTQLLDLRAGFAAGAAVCAVAVLLFIPGRRAALLTEGESA